MNIFKLNLFDLKDGERFEWQGKKYTLLRIDDDCTGDAVVIEDGVAGEQSFNPYAVVTIPEEK